MVAFFEVATQNIMHGHMIWGGGGLKLLRILEGYSNTKTRYRQEIDKTKT